MTEDGSELRTLASGGALNLAGAVSAAVMAAVLLVIVGRKLRPSRAGVLPATMARFVYIESIGKPLSRVVLVLVAVLLGLGALWVPLVWALPVAIGFVVAWFWMRSLIATEEVRAGVGGLPPDRASTREFWRFA